MSTWSPAGRDGDAWGDLDEFVGDLEAAGSDRAHGAAGGPRSCRKRRAHLSANKAAGGVHAAVDKSECVGDLEAAGSDRAHGAAGGVHAAVDKSECVGEFSTSFAALTAESNMIVDDEREAYVGVDVLTPPPASSVHLDKCSICVKKGRHTWAFNGWMTSEDKASFNTACNVDHADVQKLWARLQAMDCPVANKGLGPKGTTKAQIANQKWILGERLKQVLATGSLSIGLSTKLSQSCSFMSVGCDCCNAKLHLTMAYMGVDSHFDGTTVAAVNRHVVQFLWGNERALLEQVHPECEESKVACTAELACKGVKHRL